MQAREWADNRDAASQVAEKTGRTKRLAPDSDGVEEAAVILRQGGLVAFPTETVYGLGADATNSQAVARIFEAKGRPSFNPLIVHVADLEMAERIGNLPRPALNLVGKDWPAGLSVVVPLKPDAGISELVTAGQNTVALRCPKSPIALELLRALNRPIAAPSANVSGKISPTTADHVLNGLDGRIDAVIDGGPTISGLESTIVGFANVSPQILREGAFVDLPEDWSRATQATDRPVAPGQLESHYAPKASVRLNAQTAATDEFLLGFGAVQGDLTLSTTGDLVEAAARLYAALHEADARGVRRLAVAPIPETGLGRAINDRLRRAAAPRD